MERNKAIAMIVVILILGIGSWALTNSATNSVKSSNPQASCGWQVSICIPSIRCTEESNRIGWVVPWKAVMYSPLSLLRIPLLTESSFFMERKV